MTKLMVLTAVVSFAFDQISKLYVVFWLDLINLQEIDVFAPFSSEQPCGTRRSHESMKNIMLPKLYNTVSCPPVIPDASCLI